MIFHIDSHENKKGFIFFLSSCMPFIYLSCLSALAGTSNTVLNKSDELGIYIPILFH